MNISVLTLKYCLLNCFSLFSFPVILISVKLFLFSCLLAEEKEKPELLAESSQRRKRVAQGSGKTEQQVWIAATSRFLKFWQVLNEIYFLASIIGESTCCSTLPNACSHEEFDGYHGGWIYSNIEQSRGCNESWRKGALSATLHMHTYSDSVI